MTIEFKSFGQFGRHLDKLAATGHAVTEHATETAAKIIEKTAKDEIGHYQTESGMGPLGVWAPLAASTVEDKIRKGFATTSNDNPLLRTGEMRDSIHHRVSGDEAMIGSDSEILEYQEFGTRNIPPRPVMGIAVYKAGKRVVIATGNITIAWLCGLGWRRPGKFLGKVK